MYCPKCDTKMTTGYISMRHTLWGLFLAGFSYKTLFFLGDDDSKTRIMSSFDTKDAFRCKKCGITIVKDRS